MLNTKKFNTDSLKEDEFEGMKLILRTFLQEIKNHTLNNFVSTIVDFTLSNSIIEYQQSASNQGILYVDVEALISELYQNFVDKKSSVASPLFFINPRPFFTLGANYAYFLNPVNPLTDNVNSTRNLSFASEKVGFIIKFTDRKYTRAFKSGETYKYKGRLLMWKEPQPENTISDVNLLIYGSGLLYNLANLKTDQKFNYGIIGSNLGITFYNGLKFSLGIGSAFTAPGTGDKKLFFTGGFDIPLFDYISALRSKSSQ